MEDSEYLALSQLFDSLGIVEKGIEKIYHYLLINLRIENLKEVCDNFKLTLKRGYKICSVLNDLTLVQIYDRPMKVYLATPVIHIWQKLINNRIAELQIQFQKDKDNAENAFKGFINNYNLEEVLIPEPVEFINFDIDNLENLSFPLDTEKSSKMAIGIRYETPMGSVVQQILNKTLSEAKQKDVENLADRIIEKVENISIHVIFNYELVRYLLNQKTYDPLVDLLKSYKLKFKELKVRITEEDFSNFTLTDTKFVQPCFDPANKLLGLFATKDENIFKIFEQKFNEVFDKGVPINEYLKRHNLGKNAPLSDIESFALCIM